MHNQSMQLMKQFVDRYIQSGQNVLDVGSQVVDAQKDSYRMLMPEGVRYTGFDVEDGQNVDIVAIYPYQWPFRDGQFDAVLCGQVLEHVEFPWLTMQEIARVLKPGGYGCIIAPSAIPIHRYPIDAWRFNPDGMAALAKWAMLDRITIQSAESDGLIDCRLICRKGEA